MSFRASLDWGIEQNRQGLSMSRTMSADIRIAAPLLGQTAHVYTERAALAPLRQHFRCTWFHRVPQAWLHSTLVVPDGCLDLLWIGGTFWGAKARSLADRISDGGTPDEIARRLEAALAPTRRTSRRRATRLAPSLD